jgi:RND family efflux transporter MFP subunit
MVVRREGGDVRDASVSAPTPRAVEINGVVSAIATATVRAKTAGDLRTVECAVGQRVEAGQVCARIDQGLAEEGVSRARAALAAAQRRLQGSAAAVDAAKALVQRARSQQASRRARVRLERAQAQFSKDSAAAAAREKALAELREHLAATAITAPLPGTVMVVHATPGQRVSPSDREALFVIAPEQGLRIEATLEAPQAALIKPGNKAVITLDHGGQELTGRLREIRDLNDLEKSIVIGAEVPNVSIPVGSKVSIRISPDLPNKNP